LPDTLQLASIVTWLALGSAVRALQRDGSAR
jgi:hypothetical protein